MRVATKPNLPLNTGWARVGFGLKFLKFLMCKERSIVIGSGLRADDNDEIV